MDHLRLVRFWKGKASYKLGTLSLTAFLIVLMLIGSFVNVAQVPSSSSQFSTYVSQAVASISSFQIQKYAEILSSFGSRVTGYPGNLEAAKYIASVFKSDGLQVINQSFTTAMPVDTGSWIYADGKNLTVYALWPNGPVPGATPTYVSGPFVYVGDGSPR